MIPESAEAILVRDSVVQCKIIKNESVHTFCALWIAFQWQKGLALTARTRAEMYLTWQNTMANLHSTGLCPSCPHCKGLEIVTCTPKCNYTMFEMFSF